MGEINLSSGRRRIAAYGITLKSPKDSKEEVENIHEQSQEEFEGGHLQCFVQLIAILSSPSVENCEIGNKLF